MHVDIVESGHIEPARLEAWLHLFQSSDGARFYLHPHWIQCVGQHLHPGSLSFAFLYNQDQLVLVMPLSDSQGKHRRRHPAHDHLSLNDLLVKPAFASDPATFHAGIKQVLSAHGSNWWDWRVSNVPSRSALAQLVTGDDAQSDEAFATMVPGTRIEPASAMNTEYWSVKLARQSASFDCTAEDCPPHAKLKRNLRRLRNQLQTDAVVRVDQISDPDELANAYDVFLATESSGWKSAGQESTAIAANPELVNFYRALLATEDDLLKPVINLLWRNDECCAAQFGLRTGDCLSLLKIGYNEAFARFSPGYLLLETVLQEAPEQGINTLSLVTSPPWAERWHPATEPVWNISHYNNTTFGIALRQLEKIKDAAKSRLKTAA